MQRIFLRGPAMKKVLSLVIIFMFGCSVFFTGCDKGKSGSTSSGTQSNETSGSTTAQAPQASATETKTSAVNEEASTEEQAELSSRTPDVIFVPTPYEVVNKMLEMAKVTKNDIVYDLGCGDGRIVVTAAQKYGCKAMGFDIDPQRIKESLENVEKNDVGELVTIEQKDIFTLDLSPANVITLYLLPSLNVKLIPQLEKLRPGSRIVSHDFDMRGVKPDEIVTVTSEDGSQHTVYLWTTPLKKETEEDLP
jgi:protein-L-isoaspartate O-methyltransferase